MKKIMMFLMLVLASICSANDIVVLTETPVAEFALPDGSVLKNAYVWRRNSQGLMIMHDGGSFFLNYASLPAEWRTAYLGEPSGTEKAAPASSSTKDKYKVGPVLDKVPGLSPAGRELLLTDQLTEALDQQVLVLGLTQSLLANDRDAASRFFLIIEEKGYKLDAAKRADLFKPCAKCAGDGRIDKTCSACEGSTECSRCEGSGERSIGIGKEVIHCTTCRGSGKCATCKGNGKFAPACQACRGAGKLTDKTFCEIHRDYIVQQVNEAASPEQNSTVVSSASAKIDAVLKELPGMNPEAGVYYLSERYDGRMDTKILVACFMHALDKGRFEDAARYKLMSEVLYPETEVLDVDKYIKHCTKCDAAGRVEKECRRCEASGECERCEGSGERDLEVDGKYHCTTCGGTGKCAACEGRKLFNVQCTACKGRGRTVEVERVKVRREILVDELNSYPGVQ